MFGKGAIIMVIGFAIIAGYMNLNIAKLTSRSVETMVGYNQLNASRDAANAGANVGLAMLSVNKNLHGTLTSQSPQTGGFKGASFVVTVDTISVTQGVSGGSSGVSYITTTTIRLRSIATYKTNMKFMTGDTLTLKDTVEVWLAAASTATTSFTTFSWMTVQEGNVFFITGDTLYGQVHSNSNIHVDGRPVFTEKVTTSGRFDPKQSTSWHQTDNKAVFLKGFEEGASEVEFPNDLSLIKQHATNSDTVNPLYVQLKPGTSADNDGYALVRTGSWSGALVDSMPLNSVTNNVIYSRGDIRVKGTLDGRLTICSNDDVYIDDDIRYEKEPDPYKKDPHDPANSSTDMLGLVAEDDVIISDNTANNHNDLYLDGSIFCRTGSFQAENYNGRGVEGRIYSIGSIAQQTRGAVGNFSGNTIKNGYLKSYHYDYRLADATNFPPFFPGYSNTTRANAITNWWESGGQPIFF
jgi:hypothetical protein